MRGQILNLIIICLTWLCPDSVHAQHNTTFAINELTTATGLSQNTNTYVYKDSYGFVWISSLNGLNRFDGHTVRVYKDTGHYPGDIRGSVITSNFFEDPQGDIWFTTDRAIHCYRRRIGHFDYYFARTGQPGWTDIEYNAFYLDGTGYLWFTARDTLFTWFTHESATPAKAIAPLPKGIRFAVIADTVGHVKTVCACFWDYGNGLEILKFDKTGKLTTRQKWFDEKSALPLVCRHAASDGQSIWLATNKGLVRFNPSTLPEYQIYTISKQEQSIQHISLPNAQTVVTVASSGNVYIFQKDALVFSAYRKESNSNAYQPSPAISTNSLAFTPDGILWMGKYSEGIKYTHFSNSAFQHVPLGKTDKNYVSTQITEDASGNVWCLNRSNQLDYLEQGIWKTVFTSGVFPKIYLDNAGLNKIITTDGITTLKRNTKILALESPMHGLPHSEYYLVADQLGNYFLGTNQGLYTLSAFNNSLSQVPALSYFTGCLHRDLRNNLWVGDGGTEGINIYSTIFNHVELIQSIHNIGLVNHIISDKFDARVIWAGSSRGLIRIDVQTYIYQLFGEQDGLPDSYINAVIQDSQGLLWLSTNQGIIRFDPNRQPFHFDQYTTRDGLGTNEFSRSAALMDRHGYLWFGSTKGVDVFHPDSIHDIGTAPQLAIVGLQIHDRPWQSDSAIEVVRRIELPYNQNTLRLELAAMEYLDPAYNKFKVMLQSDGEAAAWTDLGTQNFVTYANLRPGDYTFRFIACNAEGIWVEDYAARTLRIIIHPHWSDTWWFRVLLAALLLSLVAVVTAFYYRYRLRAKQLELEKQQREAERQRLELEKTTAAAVSQRKIAESEMKLLRSQLNPHFLFNTMNSINRYILSNERDKASEYLGQFAKLTRSILNNSRSLSIPLADELKMLDQYLALENQRFQQHIHWTFTLSPDVDEDIVLVPSLLLQPFAENALLHGLAPKGGGHIAVEISKQADSLQCIIRDDGVGRQAKPIADGQPRHASAGMGLISERLDAFAALEGQAASLVIHDLKDADGRPSGTEVVIRLPWIESV